MKKFLFFIVALFVLAGCEQPTSGGEEDVTSLSGSIADGNWTLAVEDSIFWGFPRKTVTYTLDTGRVLGTVKAHKVTASDLGITEYSMNIQFRRSDNPYSSTGNLYQLKGDSANVFLSSPSGNESADGGFYYFDIYGEFTNDNFNSLKNQRTLSVLLSEVPVDKHKEITDRYEQKRQDAQSLYLSQIESIQSRYFLGLITFDELMSQTKAYQLARDQKIKELSKEMQAELDTFSEVFEMIVEPTFLSWINKHL